MIFNIKLLHSVLLFKLHFHFWKRDERCRFVEHVKFINLENCLFCAKEGKGQINIPWEKKAIKEFLFHVFGTWLTTLEAFFIPLGSSTELELWYWTRGKYNVTGRNLKQKSKSHKTTHIQLYILYFIKLHTYNRYVRLDM